jgi:hypothetical protein
MITLDIPIRVVVMFSGEYRTSLKTSIATNSLLMDPSCYITRGRMYRLHKTAVYDLAFTCKATASSLVRIFSVSYWIVSHASDS